MVRFRLPGQLRLAGEVVFVELDQRVEAGAGRLGQAVGVLAHDEVALLQPHDPLGFETERCDPEIGAGLQQRLPQGQGDTGWHVHLIGELAGETDPPHDAAVDACHRPGPHPHVPERLRIEVDIGQTPQQLP